MMAAVGPMTSPMVPPQVDATSYNGPQQVALQPGGSFSRLLFFLIPPV
jgi:hypothetical protein